ncbi:hypothetical protein A8990_12770 [Paenibacillus taihuensis]|uniref:Ricin-type beta-trefoil lectin protein n=1 Tax=Paenibacillus taihuensis TaxID=1156355 RepID=A0A3D9RQY8_9BACL|nr:hypothetical protein A8990_12770 [Paenibacillus taihuensis]
MGNGPAEYLGIPIVRSPTPKSYSSNALHNTGDSYNGISNVYYEASTPVSWNLNDQLWQITSAGNGYYKLINKKWGMLLHNTGGPRIWGFRELIT